MGLLGGMSSRGPRKVLLQGWLHDGARPCLMSLPAPFTPFELKVRSYEAGS